MSERQKSDLKTHAVLSLLCQSVAIEANDGATEPDKLPRFSMVAYTGAPMKLAGWYYPVVVDLGGLQIPSQNRPVRFNHDATSGVGHTDMIQIKDGNLIATGVFSRDTAFARDIVSSAARGFPWQASIGASVEEVEFVKADQKVMVNGREFSGPLNVVRKSILGEISFVDLGADGATSASVMASCYNDVGGTPMEKEVQKDVRASPDQDLEAKKDQGDAIRTDRTDVPDTEVLVRAKKEKERLDAIHALADEFLSYSGANKKLIQDIIAKAEEEGWSAQRTELELRRQTRPKVKTTQEERAHEPEVLQCALALAAGVSDEFLAKDRDYGPNIVEQAWKLRRLGLRGIIAEALKAAGHYVPYNGAEMYRKLLEVQAAGGDFSTVGVVGIITTTINKILLAAFTSVQVTYEIIADQRDFTNFNTYSIYRLDYLGDFVKVPPSGEIHHGRLSETKFTNKLDTYGLLVTLPRQAIINDDLGAFNDLAMIHARKARLAVEKALYNLVCEATDSFYTVAQGNRLTQLPLSVNNLGPAEAALMSMADANGDPIYALPKYLLVPPALRSLADAIYGSTTVVVGVVPGTIEDVRPSENPYKGRFQVVTSPFLQAASIPGSSPTTWYLLADPAVLPAFQVAYLNGQRAPMIETTEADFDVLGLRMRIYWDFGVARLDYRGIVKCTAT